MEKPKLEDFKINVRFKLSALWATVTFCYLYGDYFELYVPGKTEGLVNGINLLDSPVKLFASAVLLAVPALMVFLSLVLNPVLNKRLNIVLGIFFTAIMVLLGVLSIEPWRAFYVFLAILESIITSVIVWYAIKWPREAQN
ncbi:hypothetical protein MTsPCn9_04840 [Croceitalea sp. MTPC9]|uniref:DUF6326 family protein n=1 Tax=unclassified Croceitalea TaxID=2632280 RepID=UPI002B38F723|nr:hypothetical protein MTsPCn6_03870 [Croceitalea sp. MTPC6]GMN15548.1 hypothetical protein MTsPCn9_04840 [Croceitalea sp. MTPC9]